MGVASACRPEVAAKCNSASVSRAHARGMLLLTVAVNCRPLPDFRDFAEDRWRPAALVITDIILGMLAGLPPPIPAASRQPGSAGFSPGDGPCNSRTL